MRVGGTPAWLASGREWLVEAPVAVLLFTAALCLREWPRVREGDRTRLVLACRVLRPLALVLPVLLMAGPLGRFRCRRRMLGMHLAILLPMWLTSGQAAWLINPQADTWGNGLSHLLTLLASCWPLFPTAAQLRSRSTLDVINLGSCRAAGSACSMRADRVLT